MLHHIINYVLHHHQWMALSMMHSTITILWLCQKGITLSTLHSTMQYSSNVALHIHCCNTLPMTYYTINDAFSHQHSITLPETNYFINTALYFQRCTTSSRMHFTIIDAFYHQHCITVPILLYNINASLHHQHWITSSMLHCIINTELQDQCCITSSMLLCTYNIALYFQRFIKLSMLPWKINFMPYFASLMQNCVTEICSTNKLILKYNVSWLF